MHHLMQMIHHTFRHTETLEDHQRTEAESMDLMNMLFRWARNSLALLGLFSVAIVAFLYIEGRFSTSEFSPKFLEKFGEFSEKTLESEISTAMTLKFPLKSGVSVDDASESIKNYAKKMQVDLIDSHVLQKSGKVKTAQKVTKIFELHDSELTMQLLQHNPDFSAFLPFRIALHKSGDQAWLMTVDLELLIHGARNLDENTRARALMTQDELLKIMSAGANGTK